MDQELYLKKLNGIKEESKKRRKKMLASLIGLNLIVIGCGVVKIYQQHRVIHQQNQVIKQANKNSGSLKLSNNDHVTTKNFAMDYYEEKNGDYSIVVYPSKHSERIISQAGKGADGVELINVSKHDKRFN